MMMKEMMKDSDGDAGDDDERDDESLLIARSQIRTDHSGDRCRIIGSVMSELRNCQSDMRRTSGSRELNANGWLLVCVRNAYEWQVQC